MASSAIHNTALRTSSTFYKQHNDVETDAYALHNRSNPTVTYSASRRITILLTWRCLIDADDTVIDELLSKTNADFLFGIHSRTSRSLTQTTMTRFAHIIRVGSSDASIACVLGMKESTMVPPFGWNLYTSWEGGGVVVRVDVTVKKEGYNEAARIRLILGADVDGIMGVKEKMEESLCAMAVGVWEVRSWYGME